MAQAVIVALHCREFLTLPFYGRKVHLITLLRRFRARQIASDSVKMQYTLDDVQVCRQAFCLVMGKSSSALAEMWNEVKELSLSAPVPEHGNKV